MPGPVSKSMRRAWDFRDDAGGHEWLHIEAQARDCMRGISLWDGVMGLILLCITYFMGLFIRVGRSLWVVCAVIVLGSPTHVLAADCKALLEEFDRALKSRDIASVKQLEKQIVIDAICSVHSVHAQRRRAGLQIMMSLKLQNDPSRQHEREKLLMDACEPHTNWVASYALGELRLSQKSFVEAYEHLTSAIEIIKNPIATPKCPSSDVVLEVIKLSEVAALLAVRYAQEKSTRLVFGGYASHRCWPHCTGPLSVVRETKPQSTVLPISFESGSSQLSSDDRTFIDNLTNALIEGDAGAGRQIVLIGHADSGESRKNRLRLSAKRAEAIAAQMVVWGKQRHASFTIKTEGRAEREPFTIEDAKGLARQELQALNRRVEMRLDDAASEAPH